MNRPTSLRPRLLRTTDHLTITTSALRSSTVFEAELVGLMNLALTLINSKTTASSQVQAARRAQGNSSAREQIRTLSGGHLLIHSSKYAYGSQEKKIETTDEEKKCGGWRGQQTGGLENLQK